jgi:putative ABC transport system permease protein
MTRHAMLIRLLALAIAPPYRDEVVADLLDEERRARGAGRPAVTARMRLYGQLIRSAIDSRFASRERREEPGTALRPVVMGLGADIKAAWRQFRNRPALTAAALVTLALATGANTTLFSVASAVLWRSLPFSEPGRVVFLWDVGANGSRQPFAPARGLDFRQSRSLSGLALISHRSFVITGLGPAEQWRGASVSGNFFDVLGTPASIGRTFHQGELSRDVVVLGHALWRTRFGADKSIVGRTLTMSGSPRVVLGVMGPDFFWPAITAEPGPIDAPQFWTMADESDVPDSATRSAADARLDRNTIYLRAVARLAPPADLTSARAEITAMAARLAKDHPQTDANRSATLVPATEQFFGAVRRPMLLLVGCTVLVVLIAAANVANLLLVRLAGRGQELMVRLALGATVGRVMRQLTIEGLMLALTGAAIGLVIARLSFETVVRLAPNTIGRLDQLTLDVRPLALAVVVTTVIGLLLGVVPALAVWRRNRRLVAGSRGEISSGRARLRHGLVVAEIAFALVLVTGAVLFGESLLRLRRVDVGFNPSNLLTFDITLSGNRANVPPGPYFDELLNRVRRIPGVTAAGGAVTLPIGGDDFGARLTVEGQPPPLAGAEPRIGYQIVTPGWFGTLGLHLRGRDFNASDDGSRGQVLIVNETLARAAWPGQDAIGRRVRKGRNPNNPWMTVVGVVSDLRHSGPAKPARPEIYEPYSQTALPFVAVAVRTDRDPGSLVADIRRTVADFDSQQPLAGLATMEEHLTRAYGSLRFLSILTLVFGGLALLLAAIGVHGVVGAATAQRMREFGVRTALGATPRRLARLVVLGGMRPVTIGLVLGCALALVSSRAIGGLLFETAPADPRVYALAVLVLLGAAGLALWTPARRAARADAVEVLRNSL